MAFEGGPSGGFLAGLAGIFGGIASVIRGFVGITASALLKLINFLKDALIELGGKLVLGLFRLGKSLAQAVRALGVLAFHGLRSFMSWSYDHLLALSTWLKEKLGPVLAFLKHVKDHIDAIYKQFVRPVLDVIDFIRLFDRTLQVFGIDVLKALDAKLAQIEARIEEPFQWVRDKITQIEGFIDRIITLDGLLQKITLIRSMSRYAPSWMRIALAARSKPLSGDQKFKLEASQIPQDPDDMIDQLTAYMNGEVNDTGIVIDANVGRLTEFWNA